MYAQLDKLNVNVNTTRNQGGKSKMKRRLSVALILVLIVAVIAACGTNGNNSSSNSSSKSSNTSNSSSTSDSKSSSNSSAPSTPVNVKWMGPDSPTQPMLSNPPLLNKIKELTNINITLELVPNSSYTEKKTSLIATNNIPDIMRVTGKEVQTYARTGIFLNLSDYQHLMPNFMKLIEDRPEIKKLMVDGELYSFPVLENYRISVAPQPLIRIDLLEKHNLKTPETWDELYQVMKELKKQYPDSHPWTTRQKTLSTINLLSFPLGAGGGGRAPVYYEPNENRYIYGAATENFNEVISYIARLYADGIFDPDYAINTQDMAWEKLSSGKSFFYYDNNTFGARIFNPALKQLDPSYRFQMLEPMTNSFGEARAQRYQRDWLDDNYVISSKVSDPEAVVKLFDYLYSEEGTTLTNFGVEGEHYMVENGLHMPTQQLQDKVKDKGGDIVAMMRAEVGLSLLTVNINETWDAVSALRDPYMMEMADQIDALTESGEISYQVMNPPFTDEEIEALKKLENKVNVYYEQEIDKFIMGTRPISEFPSFQQKLIELGAKEMEDIYNTALARSLQ
jgi:putative aldouronate transport system substrate-binding protein